MGEAIRRTLHEQMAADERIRVFGEDVADARELVLPVSRARAACSARPTGCSATFGQARCFNTPLSEANIVGRAVGQGIRGLRPAPEIQFFDYIWPAMTQIKSEAATIRWRSNGAFTCPMVIRVPIGGYLTGGAIWHSQCGESIFAHVPGPAHRVPVTRRATRPGCCAPRSAARTRCCSSSTSTCSASPTRSTRSPAADYVIPFGSGPCVRPGDDLTIVTWGATVEKSLQAAARLAERGRDRGRGRRPPHDRSLGPRDGGRIGGARPAGCSSCTRTC